LDRRFAVKTVICCGRIDRESLTMVYAGLLAWVFGMI